MSSEFSSPVGYYIGGFLGVFILLVSVCTVVQRDVNHPDKPEELPPPVLDRTSGEPVSVCIQTDHSRDKKVWELDGGKGQPVGELYKGSRADAQRESSTAYLITSPRDDSVGWINKEYVTEVVKEGPCLPNGAGGGGSAAPRCSKGKPCGSTCIAMDKTCHH